MKETIAAIATGMSNSGIGIIRISGPEDIEISDRLFISKKNNKKLSAVKSHTVHYGNIVYEGNVIDEVLVVVMKAPNTYTREDTVEINCHGGIYVMKKILSAVFKVGARPAEPGEFTKRAFLNGRIDLSQAQAVIDIINSKNKYALNNSLRQLNGKLSEKISEIRAEILENIAYIEAALDDPEHISLDNFGDKLLITVENVVNKVDNLLKTVENGKLFTQGVKTVIIGKPNAGKSSILNYWLGEDTIATGEISEKLGRGRHTTRHTQLYPLPFGGFVADTPGFSSLEVDSFDYSLKENLADYFTEFDDFSSQCKFTGCTHTKENGCAVIDAVKSGNIALSRHESYIELFNKMKDLKPWNSKRK